MLPDGWFYELDIVAYRQLVNEIPIGGTLVELGVWKGRSICSVAEIIKERKIKVISVDTFKGSETEISSHGEAKTKNIREQFEENVKRFGLNPIIYEMTTDEASKLVEKADLIFIDAGHTYEEVKNDILHWKGKGRLAGHDYLSWESVTKAVNELLIVSSFGSVWFEGSPQITCLVCTKNRYRSTLPLTLASIANQTITPTEVVIYDDTDFPEDLRNNPLYTGIFNLFNKKNILWKIICGVKKGQHHGHQAINERAYGLIWRIDDDEIAESNVLETLLSEMKEGVGAVACSVIDPSNKSTGTVTGKIENIDKEPNIQWIGGSGEVEHLYSSFLYRRGLANYNLNLSPVAHREETMFTHTIFKKGFKLIVTNKAIIWHLRNPEGGIRTGNVENFRHDEEIFRNWLNIEDIFVLAEGLGDVIVFKKVLEDSGIKKPVATQYQELFKKYDTISLDEAIKRGYNFKDYSIYRFMHENNWEKSLYEAYKTFYKL